MNIVQIRYFVAVYHAGSFSKAAKEQFVTVQAVSKSIADLESELGRELFERKSRGVVPTAFGEAFYAKAAGALRDFDELQTFADGTPSPQPSMLRLALCAPNFNGNERVLANIRALLSRQLGANVELTLSGGFEGIDLLRKADVDALITIGRLDTPHTDCVPVLTAPPGVSFSARHPLASQESVAIEQLDPYPVCVAKDFDYFNESILITYAKRGLKSPRETILSADEFPAFLEERLGYAFSMGLPVLADDRHDTVVRPIAAQDAVPIPICLVTLKFSKSPLYLAVERFLTDNASRI